MFFSIVLLLGGGGLALDQLFAVEPWQGGFAAGLLCAACGAWRLWGRV